MIRKIAPVAVALPAAILLVACGGDSSSPSGSDGQAAQNSLIYSFPLQDQQEVPTPTPVVLRFSQSVSGMGLEDDVVLRHNGDAVPTQGRLADGGKSLILTPASKLDYHADYVVDLPDNVEINGAQDIRFSTRAAEEGIKVNVIADDSLDVMRALPSGGEQDPMMDFSTIRMQFTQPLDQQTVRYGLGGDNTLRLVDGDDNVVPAWVVVDGPYLTVDPKEDLTPGETYRLVFENNGVKSTYGESFAFANENRFRFNPGSSLAEGADPSERPQPLVQRITTPGDQGTGNGLSPLTGEEINKIPVNAVLLGDSETTNMAATQQKGDVLGDLAFLPRYPRVSPLRIRRGTLLTGSSIDVKIGGEVEAGFDSGEVRVHFLSDANGYLIPNIYDPEGPRMVRLFMDVAMSTEDAIANGGVTQNITHLELIGTVSTDTGAGVIDINAVGVVEPMILGLERGYGTLSFQLQTYRDQTPQLVDQVRHEQNDLTPPELQSWTMDSGSGEADSINGKEQLFKPGDPIVLNFNEPLEPSSVRGKVTLYENGAPMDIVYYTDGAALIIKNKVSEDNYENSVIKKPQNYVGYSPQNDPKNYHLQIAPGVTDLAGNATVSVIDEPILTPEVVTSKQISGTPSPFGADQIFNEVYEHSPIVLAAYPGFPCVLSEEGRDLDSGFSGRCIGGIPAITDGTEYDNRPADDSIPVMDLPANRPIIVQFSSNIDADSVVLGETFKVEAIDASGTRLSDVDGVLNVTAQEITFTPNEPWVNGQLYQYIVASSGYDIEEVTKVAYDPSLNFTYERIVASADYSCGADAVCGENGLPLQTRAIGSTTVEDLGDTGNESRKSVIVTGPEFDAGGPSMVQYFRGAKKSGNVLQVLRTAPESDTNHNFFHEAENPYPAVSPTYRLNRYDYVVQELSAENVAGDGSYPDYDPNGVETPKNSAKVLSKGSSQSGGNITIPGVAVGCNFQAGPPPLPFLTTEQSECPRRKFTYLSGAIVAEVTDEITDQGLKVLLWPSQVVGTALPVFGLLNPSPGIYASNQGYTGPQFLRMRFTQDGAVAGGQDGRNRPIIGWISEEGGEPVLNAQVDLYLDVPYTTKYGIGSDSNSSNLQSYPISMQLTGPIRFLDDGRMVIEQRNTNEVNVSLRLHTSYPLIPSQAGVEGSFIGYGDLLIPPYGSRLNFLSRSIK